MRIPAAVVLALLPGLLWLSPLAAEVVELTAVKDNSLYEDAEGDLSNGAGTYLFMGRTGPDAGSRLRRALVEFDLAGIPDGAVIDSVTLRVTINNVPQGGGAPDTATLHRVGREWGEAGSNAPGPEGGGAAAQAGDATWLHHHYPDQAWAMPGGDFDDLPSATAAFGTGLPETLTFASTPELVADVRAWLRDPGSNHGWMLRGDEVRDANARRLASRECGLAVNCLDEPPTLVVEYHVPSVTDHVGLTQLTAALTQPVGVAHAGDGTDRLFVIEQQGVIRIFDTATQSLLPTPFLDIRDEVFSLADGGGGNEQGLLGLAFHPGYPDNGRFFVNYTSSPAPGTWRTVVAEFTVSGDPDLAMEVGEVLLEFEQEARNHNGGDLHFGPDGYLYIASGDGGGAGDTYDNAQDLGTLRGAMLRIDVDGSPDPEAETCGIVSNYGIPPGNPFAGAGNGCDEILHFGLRNPWRFSFDARSGELWIADVGQNAREEINRVAADAAGLNFGWPCREGTLEYNPDAVCTGPLTEPVFDYAHVDGNCSVTGGYLYRGDRLPLGGRYLFGDWCTARAWVLGQQDGAWSAEEIPGVAGVPASLSSFGQGPRCELYAVDREGGALFRLDDAERLFGAGFEARSCR